MKSNQSRRRPRFQPAAEVAGQVEILGCVPRSVRGCWKNLVDLFRLCPGCSLGVAHWTRKSTPTWAIGPFGLLRLTPA